MRSILKLSVLLLFGMLLTACSQGAHSSTRTESEHQEEQMFSLSSSSQSGYSIGVEVTDIVATNNWVTDVGVVTLEFTFNHYPTNAYQVDINHQDDASIRYVASADDYATFTYSTVLYETDAETIVDNNVFTVTYIVDSNTRIDGGTLTISGMDLVSDFFELGDDDEDEDVVEDDKKKKKNPWKKWKNFKKWKKWMKKWG